MRYTYKGNDYPSAIHLRYPEIEEIVSRDYYDMTKRAYMTMDSLPSDAISDLGQLILRELGRQWGRDLSELEEADDVNPNIIPNSLRYSISYTESATSFLDVLLELMRQSDDILLFNLGDDHGYNSVLPAMWPLCYANPSLLEPFLLEEGIGHLGKEIVSEWLSDIAVKTQSESVREECCRIFRKVLDAYISDSPRDLISDSQTLGNLLNSATFAGVDGIRSTIEDLYRRGIVDTEVCGSLDDLLWGADSKGDMTLPPIDTYSLFFSPPTLFDYNHL